MKTMKPRVGHLVRIDLNYPSTEAAGHVALVTKTLGIECAVQPIGPISPHHRNEWWFDRTHLEVLS